MEKIQKGELTKNKIIECAAELFWKNGYNATGINEILSLTEIPKGSFYFHFKSKKDLAIQIINYYEKKIVLWLKNIGEKNNWESFVNTFTAEMLKVAKNHKFYGCPLSSIGMEVSFLEPEISQEYITSINKIKEIFKEVLIKSGISIENSISLSSKALAIYVGNLLLYRMGKDIENLENMRKDLIDITKGN